MFPFSRPGLLFTDTHTFVLRSTLPPSRSKKLEEGTRMHAVRRCGTDIIGPIVI